MAFVRGSLVLLFLSWLACGSPEPVDRTDVSPEAPADVPADVLPPADGAQPGPDADDGPPDETDLPAADDPGATPDGSGSDAGDDASADLQADGDLPVGPTLCSPAAPLPAWAQASDDSWRLDCGVVVLDVRPVEDAVLRLSWRDPDLPGPSRTSYAVPDREWPAIPTRAGADGTRFVLCTAALRLDVDPDGCRVTVTDAEGTVLVREPAGAGYSRGPGLQRTVTREALPGEHFYGLGERTGALDRRGRRLVLWNQDGYSSKLAGWPPDLDPMYVNVPFVMGLRESTAYGVLTDNSWRSEFDLAAADPDAWSVTVAGPSMVQYVLGGPSMAGVLAAYGRLTGTQPLPPRWTLGYHQSKWGYSPDTQVRAIADGLRSRRIPADGIWLDIQHMDGFRSWTWDPKTFPDPREMVSGLGSIGFKTTVIADPGLKVDPAWDVYADGLAGGRFLRGDDGKPFVGAVWPGDSVFPDFTDPDARSWWASLARRATDVGVRGVWLDMNEPTLFFDYGDGNTVPSSVPAAGDGVPTSMAEAHNVYALNEARATWEGLRAAAPDRRPFLLTRAGFAGIQRYAAVWTGDAPSTWPTLATSLPMLLGLGLSGIPFVGSDVGGFGGGATPELYARWMQLGSISPFFRAHARDVAPPQEPWALGAEAEAISRAVIQDRYRLLPYLYSLFREAHDSGAPILRPLVFEFQGDPETHARDDVAMLGPWILYAPVLEEGASTRTVRLPAGRWFELNSGAVVEGPAIVTVPALTLAALPAWVREGAILPRGPLVQWSDEAPVSPLSLDVYPGLQPSSFALYEDDGEGFAHEAGGYARTVYRARRTATGAVVSAEAREGSWTPPTRPLVVRVHRVDHAPAAVTRDGAPVIAAASLEDAMVAGAGWWWDERDLSLVVVLPDGAPFTLDLAYDPGLVDLVPPVQVTFRVTVPAGTPTSSPLSVATSASGWEHQPLAWSSTANVAEGSVSLPRGEWFFYKFARGGWSTVEKWPGCVEASNRYGFAQAWPVREETVSGWADWCP